MFNGVRSCLGTFITLLLLLGVAYAGWRWGGLVFPQDPGVARESPRKQARRRARAEPRVG
jgi:hypothetical protein